MTVTKVIAPTVDGVSLDSYDINDTSTWYTHIPGDSKDVYHIYWAWTTGGSTVYMPTFNKNKDSLAADINGTYENASGAGNGLAFGDYVLYELTGINSSLTQNAYYDCDDNDIDEDVDLTKPGYGGEENTNYEVIEETHTAKQTLTTLKVYTMQEWQDAGCPIGNYWVWDSDGWAYWAAPLQPGTATGCLLASVASKNIRQRTYYAINVEGQFASAGDWGEAVSDESVATGFYLDGLTDDARELLDKIITIDYSDVKE